MMRAKEHTREKIWQMFDQISPTYDLANRVISLGRDRYWRRKVASFIPSKAKLHVLDVATGTGDQLFAIMQSGKDIEQAVGVDLSSKMLEIAQEKLETKPYSSLVKLTCASALDLPFNGQRFDCVTIAFGIRNVTDVKEALVEFKRVLKPQGRVIILEATVPTNPVMRFGYRFYMRHILPRFGRWIAKNEEAYRYLHETIATFPSGENFCTVLREAGFANACANRLTFGLVTIYIGIAQQIVASTEN